MQAADLYEQLKASDIPTEAMDALMRILVASANGGRYEPDITEVPMLEAVDSFLLHKKTFERRRETTLANYRRTLEALLIVTTDDLPSSHLSTEHIAKLIEKLTKTRSLRSIDGDKTALRQFVEYLHDEKLLAASDNPVKRLKNLERRKRPKSMNGQVVIPAGEWDILLSVAGRRHQLDRIIVALGLYGGRRVSDMLSMTVGDIQGMLSDNDDVKTFSFLNVKSGKLSKTTLPILWPEFEAELRRHLGWLIIKCGELDPNQPFIPTRLETYEFAHRDGQSRMNPGWPINPHATMGEKELRKSVRMACEGAGFPLPKGAGPHALRHSCAKALQAAGWTADEIKVYLDHEDIATTFHYLEKDAVTVLRSRRGKPLQVPDLEPPTRLDNVIQLSAWRKAQTEYDELYAALDDEADVG
jgi:integrase